MMHKWYQSKRDFYQEDRQRTISGEADYGYHWKLAGYPDPWRVSYVRNTGEIYAVMLGAEAPLAVIGVVPADQVANERTETYYRTLDQILEGWPEECGKKNSLMWVRDRLLHAIA